MSRILQSEYMYWAKNQQPVTYTLGSSEVPHFHMDQWQIDPAMLELDGASRYRYPPLREAIARKAGVIPDMVTTADGTSMANMLAMAGLIAPGDEVLIEHPVYEPLVAAARFLGAEIRHFRRQGPDFALDLDVVKAEVTARTTLIILTNLHNPTGNLADTETLQAIGALGPLVLIDEVYLDAAPGERTAALLGDAFICTASLTKVYGLSGLRCGWILASPALTERFWRLNELFSVAQAHATERLSLLALERLDEVRAGTPALLAHNRALANAFFAGRDDLEVAPMVHNVTCFPRLKRGDVDALDARLRSAWDTSIVPGRFFGLADHFRLGVGQPTPIVEEGLRRLGKALDELR
ncbi:pyridoxal phosphate-dependent aminotransferase [Allosphingosinicella sp.]|uniref:pyridoxal phosphate-dependent aminotransferase n=1 Tax=Allosphingosinicella sp. TaxID=2823234 RepID=UPI0037843506